MGSPRAVFLFTFIFYRIIINKSPDITVNIMQGTKRALLSVICQMSLNRKWH